MTDKLKVGLLDLLTLLLPGGLLIFILVKAGLAAKFIPGDFQVPAGNADSWPGVVLYIAASYVTGHFIYLLASNLDDWIYENVRKVFWNDHRLAAYVLERKAAITGIEDRMVLNGFKWSCAWLLKNAPALYAEVERLIAESKFFRSLVVVCFISCILLGSIKVWALSLLMLAMSFLSLFRYLTQRQKSIDAAYTFIITALSEIKPFPAKPDREKLFELRSKSVASFARRGKALSYETRKDKRNRGSLTSYTRKVFEVIKICIWPWYVFDISPEGEPGYRSHEIRWFMDQDPQSFKEWLIGLYSNACGPDERPDTYYIKNSMQEMSIKDRGQKGVFEIKRKLPFDDKIMLAPGVGVSFEGWYKWIVADKDREQFTKMLKRGNYKEITVEKKRWRLTVPGTDWQAEYTIVNVQGCQTRYSIALELPFAVKPADATATLISSGILAGIQMDGAKKMSYPAFLLDKSMNASK